MGNSCSCLVARWVLVTSLSSAALSWSPGPHIWFHASRETQCARQLAKVYDLCHPFLHVAQVKNTMTCENHTMCKNMLQNLIPWATAYSVLCADMAVVACMF